MDRILDMMTDSHVYAASSTISKDLPRDRFITRINYLAKLVYDTGSSVTAAEDALARMLGGLAISGSKSITPVDISDVRLLMYYAWLLSGGKIQADTFDATTSQTNVTKYLQLPVHLGADPSNPFDISAGIPAERGMAELKSKFVFPANTVGGTGVTTDTTTEVTGAVFGVQGMALPFAKPKIVEADYSPGVQTNLGYKIGLPTGAFLRRTLLMMLDSSGNRNDSYITELALEVPKMQNAKPLKLTWVQAKAMSKRASDTPGNTPAEGIPTGIVLIDWKDFIDPSKYGLRDGQGNPIVDGRAAQYGFDLRNVEENDVKLSFTVGTGSGTLKVLHHQFEV